MQQFPWLQHAFGTISKNPPAACTLRQIHSGLVLNAAGLNDREAEGDALITDQPGLTVAVRTADCVPILLVDPKHRAVAAIHAGWRGTAAQIVPAAVAALTRDFGTEPPSIYAAIGPAIGPGCYETSPEIAAQFHRWNSVVGERRLNLSAANASQLAGAGVPCHQIAISQLCTRCNPRLFFSYRRDPADPGRMLSAVGIRA